MNKDIYIIKHNSGLKRIEELLEEYTVYDNTEDSIYLIYGYKTLSDQAKQTFRVLYNLRKSLKRNPVKVSLSYLSEVLSTSEETQSARIKQLQDHELVNILKKAYDINKYEVYEPMPDYTFIKTVYNLIKRRQLKEAIDQYKYTSDINDQVEQLTYIKNLHQRGIKHFSLKDINQELLNSKTS